MLLETRDVSFRYDREGDWLLERVNLRIAAGEIVGLTGPSGVGKSSLARLLAGYAKPGQGEIVLDGKPLPASGCHPVQLVLQHPEKAVNPRWRMRRILREGWEPDAELCRMLGIAGQWLDRWPNELSGGELQRICVARALGPGTRFLIADEMTTMLDALTQAQIWAAVMQMAEARRMGVLVISHDAHLLKRLCSRTLDMDEIQGR
ncbi:ATP-binding cassette domain-containing protein [Xylanibacillus composti]|uniref:Nickel ABC transporter ATP-binding protein n=1 Tax=Xylanibacillus composti TaxID=1572762 RepID=A0A8J4M0T1_9BACL|nr:ATP-binding cassette domain-containing protein [Xylanibacillus composti]MDT9723924.1 ATP-binding cassette domain-containing protein [Xylanibacillus composti]GIQ67804.1 nickel ABC transporter ATP-binding protein [Xylanibacillus composti]